MAKVDAILTCYNHEKFIEESVLSIIDQVDNLIVVNDHSTDKSEAILGKIANKYSKLIVMNLSKNFGVSYAHNLGCEHSDAEILLFQAGDDVALSHRREVQEKALSNSDIVFSFSNPEIIDQDGTLLSPLEAPEFKLLESGRHNLLKDLYKFGNFICAPTVALRRIDYSNLAKFPINIDYLQDYYSWLQLSLISDQFCEDKPVLKYRKHSNNLSKPDFDKQSPKSVRGSIERIFVLSEFVMSLSQRQLITLSEALGIQSISRNPEVLKLQIRRHHVDIDSLKSCVFDVLKYSQRAPSEEIPLLRQMLKSISQEISFQKNLELHH
jgi:glycosyltransferase involved in cell wall biosynthesis